MKLTEGEMTSVMRLTIGVLLCEIVSLCSELQAQQWQWLGPDSVGVDHLYARNGIIYVGSYQGLFKSVDGGKSWFKPPTNGVAWPLNGLSLVDQRTVFVTGRNGVISKSTDGGSHWDTKLVGIWDSYSNARVSLNKVQFVSASIGYAVGDSNVILKTTDGGNNWSRLETGARGSFLNLSFVDTLVGYVVGRVVEPMEPLILKTTDGGSTWKKLAPAIPYNSFLYGVKFLDTEFGLVVGVVGGGAEVILRTTDGGENWANVSGERPFIDLHGIEIIDRRLAFATGAGGTILKTTNGGDTWEVKYANPERDYYLLDVKFVNKDVGYVVGSRIILKTEDGGTS
jgi:photosystem II stability/assembly factor-like uncharacterized protein